MNGGGGIPTAQREAKAPPLLLIGGMFGPASGVASQEEEVHPCPRPFSGVVCAPDTRVRPALLLRSVSRPEVPALELEPVARRGEPRRHTMIHSTQARYLVAFAIKSGVDGAKRIRGAGGP